MTRRGFLKGVAGVGAALTVGPGCDTQPPQITGGFVGALPSVGHILRDGPPPPATTFDDIPLVIIGGGIAGLSAGWRLKKAGMNAFTLLELGHTPGGNALWGEGPRCPHPFGAHYVPAPAPEATLTRHLFEELGIIEGYDAQANPIFDEAATCYAPQERVFYKGDWYPGLYLRAGASADDLSQLEAFTKLIEHYKYLRGRDGRRAFAIPMAASSRDADLLALDALPFDRWLAEQGFTSERLLWMAAYACRDDYCALPHQVSAWAGLHYFASRIQNADPARDAPHTTLTWPEGNGHLARALASPLSGHMQTGRLVTDVQPNADGVQVSAVNVASGEVIGIRAQQVICCAPLFIAARVCAPRRSAPPGDATALPYGPWMVANLWVDKRPGGLGAPSAWDNVLIEGGGLGYVVAGHQRAEYRGPSVLTYYLPLTGDDPRAERRRLLNTPWEGWVEHILNDLRPAHPQLRQGLTRVDIARWGHAMIRPRPGWLWGERPRWVQPTGAIHYAHSDYGLPLFEEAQYAGVRAAEAALRGVGQTCEMLAPYPGELS